ncbi:hypothetical protein M413DRAFT_448167 [Hebeloma cylindrosporum]|uniref:Uncharacterized protein n=1 Tax=Hebeloma cylindrosporum TaxID=76867 RepID=A0A0C3C2Q9_HEBCY|nr:hypothetical protein M413DRAFT_448167 [Hebeloma cylindrosporum h7]
MEEIDSLTVAMSDPAKASTPESGKRKAIPAELRQSPRKKKQAQGQSSRPQPGLESPTPNFSPISSFSRSINHSPMKRRREDVILIPKKKELDLRPLHDVGISRQPSKNNVPASGPPTSPIEDPSIASAYQASPKKLALEASDMYLEVKKRIANHQSSKHSGKVIKLKPSRKPVAQPTDEPSIIYVSSSPSSRASSPAPVVLKQKAKEKEMKTAVEKPKAKTKGKKEKPPPVTPADYARMLQVKAAAAATASSDVDPSTSKSVPKRKASGIKFLHGKHIFYTGGDRTYASETTRGRMDLVCIT